MSSLGDVVMFVTGPMAGVSVVPSGLRTTINGSFSSMKCQNRSRFCTLALGKSSGCSGFNTKMMAKNENPLGPAELDRRQQTAITSDTIKAEPKKGVLSVSLAELQLPMSSLKLREVGGRTQIVAEVNQDGVPYLQPPKPTSTVLTPEIFSKSCLKAIDGPGSVPSNVSSVLYLPTKAPREGMPIPKDGRRRKKGGTIFGIEDRYTFNPNTYPWQTTGQIRTAVGRCTGTVIGRRLVLTASHCVNWGDGDENPGFISFSPAYYNGNRPYGEHFAGNIIYWNQASGGLTDLETAFDYVVLVMPERIGDLTGYVGYRTYNGSWNDQNLWQYLGYAEDLGSGERPAFQGGCVVSSNQSQSLSGRNAFVLGHFNDFTPGQSGGSAWGWWGDESFPRVIGVGSTIGSTAVEQPHGSTIGDNEYGGGDALSALITYARDNYP